MREGFEVSGLDVAMSRHEGEASHSLTLGRPEDTHAGGEGVMASVVQAVLRHGNVV